MRCVAINASGVVTDVDPQPSDTSTCTMVLAAPSEISASPFLLTLEEGGMIAVAISLLWGAAFGLRQLRRAL
jgi:heat shock protein HspQ